MHFIKQRAATTGSYQKPHLAHPIRPLSNPNFEPCLSYKRHYVKYPRIRFATPAIPPSLQQHFLEQQQHKQSSGSPIPEPQQITSNQAIQPAQSQNLDRFHQHPPPPTRACTTGWLANLRQNPNHYGGRFAAPPALLTHPHDFLHSSILCHSGQHFS